MKTKSVVYPLFVSLAALALATMSCQLPASAMSKIALAQVHTLNLYRGDLGRLPDRTRLSLVALGAGRPTPKYVKGATVLDTSASYATIAGYVGGASLSPAIMLDRQHGFELAFRVQIQAEAHRVADRDHDGIEDRAGFSVLFLGNDAKGVELGFWSNRIWAQADGIVPAGRQLLTQAESVAFATNKMVQYRLQIKADVYTLIANDVPILNGPVRDYKAFNGFPDVYEVPNFLFMGDDTGSGLSRVAIQEVTIVY